MAEGKRGGKNEDSAISLYKKWGSGSMRFDGPVGDIETCWLQVCSLGCEGEKQGGDLSCF